MICVMGSKKKLLIYFNNDVVISSYYDNQFTHVSNTVAATPSDNRTI